MCEPSLLAYSPVNINLEKKCKLESLPPFHKMSQFVDHHLRSDVVSWITLKCNSLSMFELSAYQKYSKYLQLFGWSNTGGCANVLYWSSRRERARTWCAAPQGTCSRRSTPHTCCHCNSRRSAAPHLPRTCSVATLRRDRWDQYYFFTMA